MTEAFGHGEAVGVIVRVPHFAEAGAVAPVAAHKGVVDEEPADQRLALGAAVAHVGGEAVILRDSGTDITSACRLLSSSRVSAQGAYFKYANGQ